MQISCGMVSNAHVRKLIVSLLSLNLRAKGQIYLKIVREPSQTLGVRGGLNISLRNWRDFARECF